jgi:hypothetical protein
MAWAATHSFAVGEVLSASNMNLIQANINDLDRRTTTTGATVATSQTTTSTSYTDLATTGPAVTVTIGSSGLAFCDIYSSLSNTVSTNAAFMSFAVSGATTVAAADAFSTAFTPPIAGAGARFDSAFLVSSLVAGSNTFTAKYKGNTSGTFSYTDRKILVTPLGS